MRDLTLKAQWSLYVPPV